jgi:hypothetical protein
MMILLALCKRKPTFEVPGGWHAVQTIGAVQVLLYLYEEVGMHAGPHWPHFSGSQFLAVRHGQTGATTTAGEVSLKRGRTSSIAKAVIIV